MSVESRGLVQFISIFSSVGYVNGAEINHRVSSQTDSRYLQFRYVVINALSIHLRFFFIRAINPPDGARKRF